MINEIKTFEERKNELLELGKKNDGKITYEEIAEHLKGLEADSDMLDELYNMFVQNGIVIEAADIEDEEDDNDTGEDLLADITQNKDIKINDPVRM